ncbi:hypothetical protein HOI18_00010 [Candidatus Uhrbacteria bacterium]|jgi:hypothetical protein|nr:hypothetical protein [Candidatus Uhrbacteria bacterium]
MIWFRKRIQPLETIARTGFLTSLVSYITFWLFDIIQPGFVSRYFSVHIFLLGAVIFGLWWSSAMDDYIERPGIQLLFALVFGILLAVLTFALSKDMSGYRLILSLISFTIPWIVLRLLKS